MVIFDFDKTIVRKDTLFPFAVHMAKIRRKWIALLIFFAAGVLFKTRLLSNKQLKQSLLSLLLNGYSKEALKRAVGDFEEGFIRQHLNEAVVQELQKARETKRKVIIASANLSVLLANLNLLDGTDLVATQVNYEQEQKKYKIAGDVCRGETKLRMLTNVYGEAIIEHADFFADSEDHFLLSKFKLAHMIEP